MLEMCFYRLRGVGNGFNFQVKKTQRRPAYILPLLRGCPLAASPGYHHCDVATAATLRPTSIFRPPEMPPGEKSLRYLLLVEAGAGQGALRDERGGQQRGPRATIDERGGTRRGPGAIIDESGGPTARAKDRLRFSYAFMLRFSYAFMLY